MDETSLITNNFRKSLKHRDRESQRMRMRKIIRDRMNMTETQSRGTKKKSNTK